MRRFATVLAVSVSMSVAALLLISAPALAAPGKAAHPHAAAQGKSAKPVKPAPKKPVKRVIEVTGVLSDTATASISLPSDTPTATVSDTPAATITIKVRVKGGERSLHGKTLSLVVDGKTVVRRGARGASLASLRPGDKVSVKAARLADGRWYALRVNAAPRGR